MKGDKTLAAELSLNERILQALNEGISARALTYTEDERALLADIALLSLKLGRFSPFLNGPGTYFFGTGG